MAWSDMAQSSLQMIGCKCTGTRIAGLRLLFGVHFCCPMPPHPTFFFSLSRFFSLSFSLAYPLLFCERVHNTAGQPTDKPNWSPTGPLIAPTMFSQIRFLADPSNANAAKGRVALRWNRLAKGAIGGASVPMRTLALTWQLLGSSAVGVQMQKNVRVLSCVLLLLVSLLFFFFVLEDGLLFLFPKASTRAIQPHPLPLPRAIPTCQLKVHPTNAARGVTRITHRLMGEGSISKANVSTR
jgi:hypothetical protein